jgi:2-haloacid dehalogenase
MIASTAVFDVNETLLNLIDLDDLFLRIFGRARARRDWFALVLRNAMSLTVTGDYADFVEVGRASLTMAAEAAGVTATDEDIADVAAAMTSLRPHPDVVPALEMLQAAGIRMAALTNSPPRAAETQLESAGIAPFFDEILSVEAVRRFKPAAEVYESAARRLGVAPGDMVMVAAHDWDVAGAMRAGCKGAYVRRPGTALNPLYPPPDIVEPDMRRVAERLLG